MSVPEPFNSERFFFHLISDEEVIRDETGVILATEGGIPVCAARAIEELRQEGFFRSGAWQGWQIEITDSAGDIIFSFPLAIPIPSEAFPCIEVVDF